MSNDDTSEVASGVLVGSAAAIALLVKCLESAESLPLGEYADVLKDHVAVKDKARKQIPYLLFQSVLSFLEDSRPNPDGRPHLQLIEGGLSES